MDSVGRRTVVTIDPEDQEAITAENSARSKRNAAREAKQCDPDFIEEISDDESFFDEPTPQPFTPLPLPFPGNKITRAFSFLNSLTPNTAKRVVGVLSSTNMSSSVMTPSISTSTSTTNTLVFKDSDTVIMKTADTGTEIPRPIINLTKAKIHVPLTLLTLASLRKIHLDPSCVKMKKGLVLDNPKMSVMDTSTFPAESTLPADCFYEAYSNFLKMMAIVADEATIRHFVEHRDFCLSRCRDSFLARLGETVFTLPYVGTL
ncbi:uncharacterized protein F5147DRAFT_778261 [Suillus discolor]|uniref:Uncharacterized protein n=1 Tax=Suillus discolor TaxID=1912936 RepID=A0A9P7EYZ7_9AGAM|nr:uncharacterized protein F5147DRAFT_778261 [Suillus discolor]KAG2096756.1 hypothetical protein F5147DRAFT_778261 [Suillus discolor]